MDTTHTRLWRWRGRIKIIPWERPGQETHTHTFHPRQRRSGKRHSIHTTSAWLKMNTERICPFNIQDG